MKNKPAKLTMYYSGSMMGPSQPERAIFTLLGKKPDVMLTYWEVSGVRRLNETLRRIKRLKRQRKKGE